MSEKNISIEQILKHFRELVAAQAQEIVILKATLESLEKAEAEDKVE